MNHTMKSSEYQQKKELDWQMTQIRVSVYLNLICLYNFNIGHNKFIQLSCCYLTELL